MLAQLVLLPIDANQIDRGQPANDSGTKNFGDYGNSKRLKGAELSAAFHMLGSSAAGGFQVNRICRFPEQKDKGPASLQALASYGCGGRI